MAGVRWRPGVLFVLMASIMGFVAALHWAGNAHWSPFAGWSFRGPNALAELERLQRNLTPLHLGNLAFVFGWLVLALGGRGVAGVVRFIAVVSVSLGTLGAAYALLTGAIALTSLDNAFILWLISIGSLAFAPREPPADNHRPAYRVVPSAPPRNN